MSDPGDIINQIGRLENLIINGLARYRQSNLVVQPGPGSAGVTLEWSATDGLIYKCDWSGTAGKLIMFLGTIKTYESRSHYTIYFEYKTVALGGPSIILYEYDDLGAIELKWYEENISYIQDGVWHANTTGSFKLTEGRNAMIVIEVGNVLQELVRFKNIRIQRVG
jgi:uncharacterized protein YodC (DUF2158 family)